MLETPTEIGQLQQLLDRSAAGAGPHMKGIITGERRLSAEQLCQRLQGMKLLVNDPAHGELRQAMLNHYLPRQGPEFQVWLDESGARGARIVAEKMFTFALEG